jgi:hypothetical protein
MKCRFVEKTKVSLIISLGISKLAGDLGRAMVQCQHSPKRAFGV